MLSRSGGDERVQLLLLRHLRSRGDPLLQLLDPLLVLLPLRGERLLALLRRQPRTRRRRIVDLPSLVRDRESGLVALLVGEGGCVAGVGVDELLGDLLLRGRGGGEPLVDLREPLLERLPDLAELIALLPEP
jgi:hypothetical protein